jgi:hypothetical protein
MEVRGPNAGSSMIVIEQPAYPLAELDETQFSALLEKMTVHYKRMRKICRELMVAGVHYGVPGLKDEELKKAVAEGRVGLFKAGAELLLKLHKYVANPEAPQIVRGDVANAETPAISVIVRCTVHVGSTAGPVVGVGMGAANSWEVKHRFRNAGRKCPNCGQPTIILSKWEARGGPFKGTKPFVCMQKAGGCGMEFAENDSRLVDLVAGRVPNPDAYDLENTLVKMAEKRAKVDATIAATGSSDLFTQDLEDMAEAETKAKAAADLKAETKPEAKAEPAKAPAKAPEKSAHPRIEKLKALDAVRDRRGLNDGEMMDLINETMGKSWRKYSQISDAEIDEFISQIEIISTEGGA